MLTEFLPAVRQCVSLSSLPVLGPSLGNYVEWMLRRSHPPKTIRGYLRPICLLEDRLLALGVTANGHLTREALLSCRRTWKGRDCLSTLIMSLDGYFLAQGRFHLPTPSVQGVKVASFCDYLLKVRGLSSVTIQNYESICKAFLEHIGFDGGAESLRNINIGGIDSFIKSRAQRASRSALKTMVGAIRGFLKFLAMSGEIASGFDGQIISSRVYRGERLPRALPWETVQAFLNAIDRSTPLGKRDYAMFLLMATYGLRRGEVGRLKLENIEWGLGRISLVQTKTGNELSLPLTDDIGTSLLNYLQQGRPKWPSREIFLRGRAPAGPMGAPAISDAFEKWAKRSGLPIPVKGPHCLRHSLAVHLLRQGSSVKEIGDILGHRNPESTCIYIRLAVEDLREVALSLPSGGRP